jgi:hypothetical protein
MTVFANTWLSTRFPSLCSRLGSEAGLRCAASVARLKRWMSVCARGGSAGGFSPTRSKPPAALPQERKGKRTRHPGRQSRIRRDKRSLAPQELDAERLPTAPAHADSPDPRQQRDRRVRFATGIAASETRRRGEGRLSASTAFCNRTAGGSVAGGPAPTRSPSPASRGTPPSSATRRCRATMGGKEPLPIACPSQRTAEWKLRTA